MAGKIDFAKIKSDYITQDVSINSLAKKYGVADTTIGRRARKDGWAQERAEFLRKTQKTVEEAVVDMRRSIAENCVRALEILAEKTLRNAEMLADDDIAGKKALSGVLKDMKEMGAFDLGENKTNEVVIRFAEEVDELE